VLAFLPLERSLGIAARLLVCLRLLLRSPFGSGGTVLLEGGTLGSELVACLVIGPLPADQLVGRLPVDGITVADEQRLLVTVDLVHRRVGRPSHETLREEDLGALHDAGLAVCVEQRDERLAGAAVLQGLGRVERGIGAKRCRGRLHGLQLGGRVGAQSMLDPVGELGEDLVGDVGGRLGDEVDAHALGANELNHLDNLVGKLFGHAVKEQVRLVKEEDERGLGGVTYLGKAVKERREHPEQEHRIDLGHLDELGGIEDVHVAATVGRAREPVAEVKRRLAEEDVTALVFHGDERALDGSHRCGRDVAVERLVLLRMLRDVGQHAA